MAGGFKMQFVADVAPFLRGTKDVGSALDKVSGSLDDLARDAKASSEKAADAVEKLGDGAHDTAADVDSATDKMERSFKDVIDDVKKAGRTSFKDFGDDAKKGTKEAGDGFREMGDEAHSTAREAAASFSGDPLDALDALQEAAANALAPLGPAGAAAGIVAAVGIGLAQAKLQELADKANEFKETAGDLGKDIASGDYDPVKVFQDWSTELQDAKSWFEVWQSEAVNNIENVRNSAQKAGVDFRGMVGPLVTGDVDAAKSNLESLKSKQDELNQVIADGTIPMGEMGTSYTETARAAMEQKDGVDSLVKTYEGYVRQLEAAHEQAVLQRAATDGISQAEAELALAMDETNRARDERIQGTRSAAQAEWDMEDAVAASNEAIKNGAKVGRDAEKVLFDQSGAALDLAAAQQQASGKAEDYNTVIASQRAQFIKTARQMGYTKTKAEELANKYGLIPHAVTTTVTANTSTAQARVDALYESAKRLNEQLRAAGSFSAQSHAATGQGGSGGLTRATGGIIPGQPSSMDNTYVHAASGEFIVNAQATAKHRELLDAINQGRPPLASTPASATGGRTYEVTVNNYGRALTGYDVARAFQQAELLQY